MTSGDDDATIRVTPQRSPRGFPVVAVAVAVAVLACMLLVVWARRDVGPPPVAVRQADAATIEANRPADIDVFRFAANPHILVLDFASLRRQGAMLNRVAAMVEKAGEPHDRVLDGAELDAAIRASGDTPETYYYGHDYGAADLAAFFAADDRQKVQLTAEEIWLRGLLRQEGFFAPGAALALISIPAVGASTDIDGGTRHTILHHELSHGEFFTSSDYAAWTLRFWRTRLSDDERAGFRAFLAAQHYDPAIETLLANETQAYLMFTPDRRFFTPRMAGLADATAARLRDAFRAGMPPGWLRDEAGAAAGR